LLVRYVVESRSVEGPGPDGQQRTAPSISENIVESESEIIKSLDLCRQVAEMIGPRKVLASSGGGSNVTAAAEMIYGGLSVEVPRRSNVIRVSMTHPDPEVARLALQHLIDFYFKRHLEIHRALGTMDAFLAEQTDQVRSRLVQMDEELRKLRTNSGVFSLEDTKRSYTEQMSGIRQMILSAEAELAEYQSLMQATVVPGATNALAATNTVNVTNQPAQPASTDRLPEYKAVLARLEALHQEEMVFRMTTAPCSACASSLLKRKPPGKTSRWRTQALRFYFGLRNPSRPLRRPSRPKVWILAGPGLLRPRSES
jgi:uncharacterized protein involved in exopolysaccharide biosynthesis